MEIRAGYKQTDVGVIPDEWEASTIGELATFSGGSQPPRSTFKFAPTKGYIRLIQIRDYKTDEHACFIPTAMARKRCTTDDIMIGRYGPPIFQILRGIEGAYNVALIKTTPNQKIEREYFFNVLRQDNLFQLIDALSQRSSGQTGVEMPALKAYGVPLPPLTEQRAISGALSDMDSLLAVQDELIVKKGDIKLAAMQQLLTGKTRLKGFDEEWKVKRIEEIASPSSDKNGAGENLPVLTCSKHIGFVDSLSFFKNQVFSKDLSTYKIIRKGQIGYPANHVEEGSIGLQNLYDVALVSPIYVVFSVNEDVNSFFLHRVLKLDSYRQKFRTATTSSVDRRGSLRWPAFSKITVMLPPLQEQSAIAEVLSEMEAELAALEQRQIGRAHV